MQGSENGSEDEKSENNSDGEIQYPEKVLRSLSTGDKVRVVLNLNHEEIIGTVTGDVETYERDFEGDVRVVERDVEWSDESVEERGMMTESGTLVAENRDVLRATYYFVAEDLSGAAIKQGVAASAKKLKVTSDE